MIHRLAGRRVNPLALSAVVGATMLSGGVASARVRATADVASTLPIGTTERIADPAFTGRGELQWLSPNERLVIGVLGGYGEQSHRLPEEPTLTAIIAGGQVGYIFGPKDWGTRPYVSLSTGYAQLGLKNGAAQFDYPSEASSSGGIFVYPEGGLSVQLTKYFGIKMNLRYQYYRSFKQMTLDKYKAYDSQTFGLALGAQVTFDARVKTHATTADIAASVLAVPPLCRRGDLVPDIEANVALIRHIEAGGISTFLYGGNANFYNIGMGEYPALLDMLGTIAGPDTLIIPSAGPDFGKMMDQAAVLRSRPFPTVMVLPQTFPMTMTGVETGLRRFAEAFGKPIVVYVKAEGYLTPEGVARLVNDGLVAAVKYAIVREDPLQDPFLAKLVDVVDRKYLVSGIGERPAITHLRDFGLAGFTSGSCCVAPRGSALLLKALRAKDYARAEQLRGPYIPLEDLRDGISPIRVLHEAVRLAGIANTGPALPLLSNLEPEHHTAVQVAAGALLATDQALAAS